MLSGIGLSEILLILLVTLVVVGPEKIPDVARMLGKGVREVRRASNLFRDMFMLEEGGGYDSGNSSYDEGRRKVGRIEDDRAPGVAGTVPREQPKMPPTRPVLLTEARRATDVERVELPARRSDELCLNIELSAPIEDSLAA